MGDSNSRHLAPKASALPTALIPDLVIEFCARCGQTCGQVFFLTTSACGGSACIAGVSRDCGHGIFWLEGGATRSQMCVGTFSRHFSALFGPFLCLGSSSLTLFCPACFKKPFRLLGFVWDWILCIKRCSARFEGGNGRPDHLSGETQELRRIKQRNTPRHDMACSEAGKCVFGPTTRS